MRYSLRICYPHLQDRLRYIGNIALGDFAVRGLSARLYGEATQNEHRCEVLDLYVLWGLLQGKGTLEIPSCR